MYIYIHTFKYFVCIINCNIVPLLHFPHITLLIIMYIHLQHLKYIKNIIKCNTVLYMYIRGLLKKDGTFALKT